MDVNDLEEQMKMLAGLGEMSVGVDLGAATSQSVPAPQAPENSINAGATTNTTAPNAINQIPTQSVASVTSIIQEQANATAEAQKVATTTTNPTMAPATPTHSFNQAPQSVATSAPVAKPTQNFAIFDEGDEPVFATLGQDTVDDRLPFINLKAGEATRIMIFTLDMITVFTHFVDGLGYFRCKSKRDNGFITLKCPCCEFTTDDGKPIYAKERKILPVIEYPVAKDGKSLLAGKQPQLKFIVLSKRDMQSLNAILSPDVIQDKVKLQQVLGMDFSVKIDDGDTFKTKVIASTFDTIRGQFTNIQEEIAKYSRELLVQARDERFRDVPVESMQAALDKERADRLAAQQLASTPVPTAASLGI